LSSYSEIKVVSSKPVKVEKNIDDFHLNLYKNVVALNSNDNVFLSPYSIGLALASVTAGARGKTEKELLNLLHSKSREKLTQSSKQLMTITNMPEIKLANRLYVDIKFPVLPSYIKQLQKTYNFTLALVNLNAQNKTPVINQINQWVSNQTNNYMKEVLRKDSLDVKDPNDTNALLIINCLFFDGMFIYFYYI
jgi:serpin B